MAIDVYQGIPEEEITATRKTSEGKTYTLNHPDSLVVNMRYKGEGKNGANSQGWERSSKYYFDELLTKHPEYFSRNNRQRILNNESPVVDAKFVKSFPQYKGYERQTLIHHHVGKDGQAVAVPQSMHKGSGEIHIFENDLGITQNGRNFSDRCKAACEKDPSLVNRTADTFKQQPRTRVDVRAVAKTEKELRGKSTDSFAKAVEKAAAKPKQTAKPVTPVKAPQTAKPPAKGGNAITRAAKPAAPAKGPQTAKSPAKSGNAVTRAAKPAAPAKGPQTAKVPAKGGNAFTRAGRTTSGGKTTGSSAGRSAGSSGGKSAGSSGGRSAGSSGGSRSK